MGIYVFFSFKAVIMMRNGQPSHGCRQPSIPVVLAITLSGTKILMMKIFRARA